MEALISLAGSHAVEVQVTAVITSDNIGKLLAEDELETGWLTNNEHPFISWELIESNKYRGCDSTHKHPSSLLIIFCGAEAAPQNFSLQLCHISWVSILYTFAVQAVVWGPVASASPGSFYKCIVSGFCCIRICILTRYPGICCILRIVHWYTSPPSPLHFFIMHISQQPERIPPFQQDGVEWCHLQGCLLWVKRRNNIFMLINLSCKKGLSRYRLWLWRADAPRGRSWPAYPNGSRACKGHYKVPSAELALAESLIWWGSQEKNGKLSFIGLQTYIWRVSGTLSVLPNATLRYKTVPGYLWLVCCLLRD